MGEKKVIFDISWSTIFKIGIVVFGAWAVLYFGNFLWWAWTALVVAILVNVLIDALEDKKIPRVLAVILVYLTGIAILAVSFWLIIPVFAQELRDFSESLPEFFRIVAPNIDLSFFRIDSRNFEQFLYTEEVKNAMVSLLNFLFRVSGGFITAIFIFGLAFFLSFERRGVEKFFEFVLPPNIRAQGLRIVERGKKRVVGWFGVRVLGAIFIGLGTFVGLTALKAPYPALFAFGAALFDLVPFVGPWIFGSVMIAVVAMSSLVMAVVAGGLFVILQQIESIILIPLVSKRIIGMHPVFVLIVVFVGWQIGGVLGMVFGLPLGAVLLEVFREFGSIRNSAYGEISDSKRPQ